MQTKISILFFILGILFPLAGAFAKESFYDFKVKDIKGNDISLSKYKGKVVMVVNVASKCGYTYQYDNLEKVYKKYKSQGFVVVGFPANNFGSQEPGTDQEIETFCRIQKGASFDMMSKISVKGKGQHPLYSYLIENSPNPGEIEWNFEKFLISKEGKVEARYRSAVEPDASVVAQKIESLLK
ncbi:MULTISPECIES: glutathione peroxidase [Leptospira]|uniref:Glutathione peroxidase n=1 Tax=Leptospira weilii str. UI 13098 TaxID=1088542 RepID=M6QUI8_9LEPT|nr:MULTISPECIES: glutathione peroxidase [Leptospira]EMJ60305.1 glutathione peroxidase [Leptospira sp. P2653]EMN92457.1 glutathione peroxidase [Leptospira weilii str. UI 13098]MDL5246659.1 glutathione peroxidase [Leptospira weilii]OMI16582.1 glutathione peroxidase [Leptospira weilii serovar Heyan]QDK21883.1 glutathione peroxidase [Leptospira weilii]